MKTITSNKIYIAAEQGNTPHLYTHTSDGIGYHPVEWKDLLPLYINIAHHLTDEPIRRDADVRDYSNIHITKDERGYLLICKDNGINLELTKRNLLSLFSDITYILSDEADDVRISNRPLLKLSQQQRQLNL